MKKAGKVQESGRLEGYEDVKEARKHGAGDRDIHDTILIAATFSMFNRYVDGLASLTTPIRKNMNRRENGWQAWDMFYLKNKITNGTHTTTGRSTQNSWTYDI